MCGICGFARSDEQAPDARVLDAMMQRLEARGPDDQGRFLGEHVALGHRRLSILDLTGGRQPLTNEDGSVQAVVNGEIYNFRELRRQLLQRGHRFRTHTDGEVLVHLYEEQGEGFLAALDGMFALALWDERRRRLLLARDRMGKKPLYWIRIPGGVAFASELKSLLAHPQVERRLDLRSLSRYLLHGYVPSPWSIFEAVHKLDRSECLRYEKGHVRLWRWWRPPERLHRPLPSLEQAAEQFWERLTQAVRRRLASDVPLGIFLSGGIDSSSLLASLGPEAQTIQTFTIGFDDPSCDESCAARRVARHFQTDHHEATFSTREMLGILPEVADYLDEPFADASVLPTYLLSRFARQWVKVALSGDGGDELLAGYPTFVVHRTLRGTRPFSAVVPWLRRAAERLLPVSHRHMSPDFLLRQYLRGIEHDDPLAHQIWMGALAPHEQADLLHPDVCRALADWDSETELDERYRRAAGPDEIARLGDFYAQTYLQEGVLAKVDRASMAHGLEVRAPFLDREVVEYVSALPAHYKLKGLETKRLLKIAAAARLPPAIVHRRKHGFGPPIAAWLAGPLREMAGDLLAPARLKAQGLLQPAQVARLLEDHERKHADHGRALWVLLMFQLWYERFACRCAPAPAAPVAANTNGRAGAASRVPLPEPKHTGAASHATPGTASACPAELMTEASKLNI